MVHLELLSRTVEQTKLNHNQKPTKKQKPIKKPKSGMAIQNVVHVTIPSLIKTSQVVWVPLLKLTGQTLTHG
jgi:hypothetical protein